MVNNMKKSIAYTLTNLTVLDVAKYFIMVVGIGNMIMNPTYNAALLLLESQISGFYMFLFILSGLITVFGVLRCDGIDIKKTIFTVIASLCSIFTGISMINIMVTALNTQTSLDVTKYAQSYVTVGTAVNLATGMCVAYGIGLLLVIFVQFKNRNLKPEE